MAEELNKFFASVFTKEDQRTIPEAEKENVEVAMGTVVATGWPPAVLPCPSKGSQPYDPKTRGNIYWPKYKGPRHVLGIFKPCFRQICALHSLFKAILLPPDLLGRF
jgi:hypothetical protein